MMDSPFRMKVCDAGKTLSRTRCGARSLHALMRRPIGRDRVGGLRARERTSFHAWPRAQAGHLNVLRAYHHNKRAMANYSR